MGGNKSTGIRAMPVTPITSSTRQMTMMKYGLRIEKPGINLYPITLLATSLLCVLFLVLHYGHGLRVDLLARFQAAAVAYYDLLSLVQSREDFSIRCRLESRLHRALL